MKTLIIKSVKNTYEIIEEFEDYFKAEKFFKELPENIYKNVKYFENSMNAYYLIEKSDLPLLKGEVNQEIIEYFK